jgi:hypothetical protein
LQGDVGEQPGGRALSGRRNARRTKPVGENQNLPGRRVEHCGTVRSDCHTHTNKKMNTKSVGFT